MYCMAVWPIAVMYSLAAHLVIRRVISVRVCYNLFVLLTDIFEC